ncbi:hypothetical protein HMPREF1039_0631 [Megasphaera lornae]|uniref:Uncharacterized protein n=1 Tax=Megasphaera lornae TaxID=1000568 RepID=A0ABN0D0T1_9FIRM|nr:hypothetical protein HMPREF1039_0631 [Megasphaera lornae]
MKNHWQEEKYKRKSLLIFKLYIYFIKTAYEKNGRRPCLSGDRLKK